MGGGLMQLVAYGAQDIYLTGNPQITFFKVVYRRHTNFSMEAIQQTIQGTPSQGGRSTVTISRNGDLIQKIYLCSPDTSGEPGGITNGSGLLNEVELEIGGQTIDKQTAEWMQIWNELSTPFSKASALKYMQGDIGTNGGNLASTQEYAGVSKIQVPLLFWFCRNPGLALPLIALQYHEVKLRCKWGSGDNGIGAEKAEIWVDYIYLDTDERRRFAQVSHEYLIEQIQIQGASGNKTTKLKFNHPVKELIWTNQSDHDYGTAQLKLNGHDRFAKQTYEYFQLRQPYDYHTAVPNYNIKFTQDSPSTGSLTFGPSVAPGGTPVKEGLSVDADDGGAGVILLDFYQPHFFDNTNKIRITNLSNLASEEATIDTINYNKDNEHITLTLTDVLSTLVDSTAGHFYFIETLNSQFRANFISRTSNLRKKINVYSFALKPEEHQPSGTCNFSRIDTAQLEFTNIIGGGGTNCVVSEFPDTESNIYAVNYNVLRIMSGMGGLAYSN